MENSSKIQAYIDLRLALVKDEPEAMIAALQNGADPNCSHYSHPPIFSAVLFGKLEIIKALIAYGADVNYTLKNGATPLHAASYLKTTDCAHILLDAGADPAVRNRSGDTPLDILIAQTLHRRPEQESIALIERMIEKGGKANRINSATLTRLKEGNQKS